MTGKIADIQTDLFGDPVYMKPKVCGNCKHGGHAFKIFGNTHLHCDHSDEEISGKPGWDSLRMWYDKYKCFEHDENS